MSDAAQQAATGERGRGWLGIVARGVLILVGVGPLMPQLTRGLPGLSWLGGAFDAWFAFQCHREPARSLSFLGEILPVCSRCLGIYLGLGLGALILWPKLKVWPLRIWVGFAALVMVLDVATETLGMRPEWTPLRLVTGLLLAYPVSGAVVRAARGEPQDD
ncbi:MAG: DUF2085 domain-containing protein [Polyangiaceae bacterium]